MLAAAQQGTSHLADLRASLEAKVLTSPRRLPSPRPPLSGWAQAAFSVFACLRLDPGPSGELPGEHQEAIARHGYWLRDLSQACYEGVHLQVYVPIGAVAVAVVCLGPPVLSALIVWHHRRRLEALRVRLAYGWLYDRYRCGGQLWLWCALHWLVAAAVSFVCASRGQSKVHGARPNAVCPSPHPPGRRGFCGRARCSCRCWPS